MRRRQIKHKKTNRLSPTVLAKRRSWWEERGFRSKPLTEVGKEKKQGRHSETELYCGAPARLSNISFDAAGSSVPHTVSPTKKVLSHSAQPFLNFKFVGSLRWCVAPTTFSLQLKILNRGDNCVPCFAVKQLALNTVYRCPWNGGLSRVAIFLGQQYCTQYFPSEGAQGMPVQVRKCVRLSVWKHEGCEVVRRPCCNAAWRGWKCYYCQRKHEFEAACVLEINKTLI